MRASIMQRADVQNLEVFQLLDSAFILLGMALAFMHLAEGVYAKKPYAFQCIFISFCVPWESSLLTWITQQEHT